MVSTWAIYGSHSDRTEVWGLLECYSASLGKYSLAFSKNYVDLQILGEIIQQNYKCLVKTQTNRMKPSENINVVYGFKDRVK